jgi:hypothetical protein
MVDFKSAALNYRYYGYAILLTAGLTFWLTSRADEQTLTKITTEQQTTIDQLKHIVDVLKETSTDEKKIYDPTTGHLISDETKTDVKDETKTTDVNTKTNTTTKTNEVVKTETNLRASTILVGYGMSDSLSKVYSAEYIRRFSVVDVGAEVSAGKEVSASFLLGVSF